MMGKAVKPHIFPNSQKLCHKYKVVVGWYMGSFESKQRGTVNLSRYTLTAFNLEAE